MPFLFFFFCSTKCCSIFLLMSVSIQPVKCLPALGPVRDEYCLYREMFPEGKYLLWEDNEELWGDWSRYSYPSTFNYLSGFRMTMKKNWSLKHLPPSQRRVLHLGTRYIYIYRCTPELWEVLFLVMMYFLLNQKVKAGTRTRRNICQWGKIKFLPHW